MGETKAIIFSTHILEEVEAACSRALIIDRGKIVANGTPAELKARSEAAGSVMVRIAGTDTDSIRSKLSAVPGVKRVSTSETGNSRFLARVFPVNTGVNHEFSRAVADACVRERWTIEELSVDQGRLDDVFRSITLPDTVKEAKTTS
jgi:ABC-2 type transport system ATP-binding protein